MTAVPRPYRLCLSFAVVAPCILPACAGPSSSSTSGFTLSDSSGITIATSEAEAWAAGQGWRLSEDPELEIGQVDGPKDYQLYRVGSGVRLEDGRIVVGNTGSLELRFYDAAGGHLFSVGGDGEGPGEFRTLWPISFLSDSLFVFDSRLMRLTVYSTSGELGRTTQIQVAPDGSIPVISGLFSDGSLLARTFPLSDPESTGLHRYVELYARYTPDGEFADTVGFFPTSERYIGTDGERTFSSEAPYGRESTVVPRGTQVFFGSSDSWEIQILARDGTLEKIIRRPIPNSSLTSEESAAYFERLEERLGGMPPMWRRLYLDVELPGSKPAYGRFLVDDGGNLWVSEYFMGRTGMTPDEGTWTVFDPEGRMLGVVETPPQFKVFQIGPDWVLGVHRDELGVERVKLFRLMKELGT